MTADNIHTVFDRMLGREDREAFLKQKSHVFWLYGLSGSGKSTLAIQLERKLLQDQKHSVLLDGDNIRSGLNSNLGFSDEDRVENIRRIAEVAKLFRDNGTIVIASFITPFEDLRERVKQVNGEKDSSLIYVKASFEACQKRDVKGLYAKATAGNVKHFTGQGSQFEEPKSPDLIIDTETESEEESLGKLYRFCREKLGY
jgi:adenylylsulfate kinase